MSEYMFPILSIDDLTSSLAFVKDTDFRKLDPNRWCTIYGMLYESLTDEKAEHGEEKALLLFPKYCKSENIELFEEASCILWFTLVLQQLFYDCGISDFTFKDMREPKQKRCILICSAVVNFMRFKANRVPIVESILEKVDRSKIQYDKIKKTNIELKNRIAIEMNEHNERENKIQQVQEEIMVIHKNVMAIKKDSQNMLTKISAKKESISKARVHRDEVKCQLMKVTEECKKLEQNIVHSPQKLKNNLNSMHEKVAAAKQLQAEKLELVSARRKRLDELKTRHGIVEQGLRFIQSIVEDVEKRKSHEEEIKALNESYQVNAHKRKAIKMQEESLMESIDLIQDRLQKVQLQKRARTVDLDAYYSATAEKKKVSTTKVDALSTEKEKLKREKEMWLEKIESLRNKQLDQRNVLMMYYKNILDGLNKYHVSLNDKISESC